jgi:hypothetical protein
MMGNPLEDWRLHIAQTVANADINGENMGIALVI